MINSSMTTLSEFNVLHTINTDRHSVIVNGRPYSVVVTGLFGIANAHLGI